MSCPFCVWGAAECHGSGKQSPPSPKGVTPHTVLVLPIVSQDKYGHQTRTECCLLSFGVNRRTSTTHHFQAQAFNSQSLSRCAVIRELSNGSRWHADGRFSFFDRSHGSMVLASSVDWAILKTTVKTGGASSSSYAGPENRRGGVSEASGSDGDLVSSLKEDWATGKLSSKKVLEYERGASSQGASGMQGMDGAGGHNAFRFLKNVSGIPAGAPDLTWLEIPTKANSKTLHLFLLLHEFVLLPQHFWGRRCMFGVLAGSVEDSIRAVPPRARQERTEADRPSWHARQHRRVLSPRQFVHDQLELLGRARRDCAKAIRVHSLP